MILFRRRIDVVTIIIDLPHFIFAVINIIIIILLTVILTISIHNYRNKLTARMFEITYV